MAMMMTTIGRGALALALAAGTAAAQDLELREDVDRLEGEADVLRREMRLVRDRLDALDRRIRDANDARASAAPVATPSTGVEVEAPTATGRDPRIAADRLLLSGNRFDLRFGGDVYLGRALAPEVLGLESFESVARHTLRELTTPDPFVRGRWAYGQTDLEPGTDERKHRYTGGPFVVPAEVWRQVRPEGAPLEPQQADLMATLGALAKIAPKTAGPSAIAIDGEGPVRRVRLSFLPSTGDEPCEFELTIVRIQARHLVVCARSSWFEREARRHLGAARQIHADLERLSSMGNGKTAQAWLAEGRNLAELTARFPATSGGEGVMYDVRLSAIHDRPYDVRGIAVPRLPCYPTLAIGPAEGEAPGPTSYDVRVITPAVGPTAAAEAPPGLLRRLEALERALRAPEPARTLVASVAALGLGRVAVRDVTTAPGRVSIAIAFASDDLRDLASLRDALLSAQADLVRAIETKSVTRVALPGGEWELRTTFEVVLHAPTASAVASPASVASSQATVSATGFVVPGLAEVGVETPEEAARLAFEAIARFDGRTPWKKGSAFADDGRFLVPAALWAEARPADAPTSPLAGEARATIDGLRPLTGTSVPMSNLVVEGGSEPEPTKRVRFSLTPSEGPPCEVTLLLARINGRWVVVTVHTAWFEARVRELLTLHATVREDGQPAYKLRDGRASIGPYAVTELAGRMLAVPTTRAYPTLELVRREGKPGEVRVVLPAATPETPPLDAPAWFQALPAEKRPRLPLPQGVRFGEAAGEYVNEKDGSVLAYVETAVAGGQARDDAERWFIGKFEVTWAQYRAFCKATGHAEPARPEFMHDGRHPVVNVSWHDAQAYAAWAGLRLPATREWEVTARGPEGRVHPWGDDAWTDVAIVRDHSRWGTRGTAPCGSASRDVSPYGVIDLAGNVAEWTSTTLSVENPDHRVLRGGSYRSDLSRSSSTSNQHAATGSPSVGFRVALDAR